MRLFQATAVLSVLCAIAGFGATTATKTTAQKSTTKKSTARSKGAKGKSTKKTPAATWRTRQQNPTPDRYKEIQQALVDKGYLKGEPSGVWDAASVDAMQRFQSDQKLTPTGKINAASLIGLGLGAKSAGAAEAAPLAAPAPVPAQPPQTDPR